MNSATTETAATHNVEAALYTLPQAAKRLAVSPDFLRAHADSFGAIRLTAGPRARIHFPIHVIEGVIAGTVQPTENKPARAAPRRKTRQSSTPLLAVKGGTASDTRTNGGT